jgi:hypothetical protein
MRKEPSSHCTPIGNRIRHTVTFLHGKIHNSFQWFASPVVTVTAALAGSILVATNRGVYVTDSADPRLGSYGLGRVLDPAVVAAAPSGRPPRNAEGPENNASR